MIVIEAPELTYAGDSPGTDRRSSRQVAMDHLADEHRAKAQASRNRARLAAWRVRWWKEFGTWPQDRVRARAQALAQVVSLLEKIV